MAFGFARSDALSRIEARLDTFATRADLQAAEQRLEGRIDHAAAQGEASTRRWLVGVAIALVAVLVGLYGPLIAVMIQFLSRVPVR